MKKIFISMLYSALIILGATSLNADDKISAYLVGEHIEVDVAKTKLQDAGFEVIASYEPIKKGTTLIFTNEALKVEGAKSKRAHAAILRMFIDDKEKKVSITNPIYFGRAFMQDWYKEDVFIAQLENINSTFPNLKGSEDNLEFEDLADYHFMMGMPYYEDPDELAEGNHKDLLAKARNYKKGKLLIFELKLSDKSTLLGYELGRKTKKFIKKIGRANAAVLPYCISIEDGKATSLAAKFYLAVSYPQLSMSEFMTISSVPGAIEKDLKKPFK
ncbi:MAG: hypothetical protein GQ474_09240 [Sulfurimonas sp.]|nr:hypothetical protein [Sulfurimonas sp.]